MNDHTEDLVVVAPGVFIKTSHRWVYLCRSSFWERGIDYSARGLL